MAVQEVGEAVAPRSDVRLGRPVFGVNRSVFLDTVFLSRKDVVEVYYGLGREAG